MTTTADANSATVPSTQTVSAPIVTDAVPQSRVAFETPTTTTTNDATMGGMDDMRRWDNERWRREWGELAAARYTWSLVADFAIEPNQCTTFLLMDDDDYIFIEDWGLVWHNAA